jgi:DNA-binding transcriptional LysR family regulator
MDSNDWVILTTINAERSLTKTAERLYISQPSLTYRLNKLEKEFGIKILDRHSSGVSFTIQGQYILKYAEEMLEKLNFVKDFVQNMNEPVSGTLRLGVSTVFAKFKIAPILKIYHNRFPDVKIVLKTGSSTLELPNMLRENIVDVIIRRGDIDWPEKKHVILEEPYGIVSSYPIEFNQLPSIPWVQDETALITKSADAFYDWWKSQFSSPPPADIIQVNSIEASVQIVSQGLGWTMIPKIHIGNQRSLFFYPLILSDGQPMLRKTIMAYRDSALEEPAVKMFVNYMLNEYHSGHVQSR